jgi:hypothetical protein
MRVSRSREMKKKKKADPAGTLAVLACFVVPCLQTLYKVHLQ